MEADDSADVLKKANEETEGLKEKLRKSETDLSALKKQCKNLQEEYDRVCTLLNKKEVRLLRLIINKLRVSGTLQR
jgi:archaellum component FlaC